MTTPGAAYVSVDDLAEITPAWRQQLDDNLMPLVAEIYQDSSGETRTQMIDLFGLPPFGNPDSEQYLSQARNRFDAMGQDLWETARSELLDGFQQGESVPELAARVRGAAGITARRAAAIARSEANAAANAGSLATARLADDGDMTKEWLATNDTRTRPSHSVADGQVVPLSERFNVGISTLDYPGDPSGPASETYNCIIDALTPIITDRGPIAVGDIRPGHLVLTHRNRFRPVTRLAQKRSYSGEIVCIQTASGVLRVTPNHPVLTDQGWVVAGELQTSGIVFGPTFVQPGDLGMRSHLSFIDRIVLGSSYASMLSRHSQADISLSGLDHEKGSNVRQQITNVLASNLPAQHGRPVLTRGARIPVHRSVTGDLTEEPDHPLVRVRDHDSHEVLPFAQASSAAGPADMDDAFTIDERGNIGGGNRTHLIIVPLPVVHCWRESLVDVPLFNFAVAEDESYVAGGIAVHNCRCTLTYGFGDEQQAEEAGPQPVSPSTAERAEQAARSRQQDVDEARKVATAAAEVDELIDAEASQRALKSRINATADRLGLPDDMRTQLLDAAESGDMAALAQAADDIARRAGLTPIGQAGQIARFDRKLHEAIAGSRITAGEPVQLVRRGYHYQRNDETILLFRAKAEALGDGLDDLDLRDLRDLAGEFDVPRRLDMARAELIRALRDRGAVSPDIARALNQLDDDLLAARQRTALAELRAAAIRQYQPNPQGLEDLVARTTDAQLDTATRTQLAGGQVGQIEKIEYPDGYELFGKDSGDWFGRDAKTITDSEQLSSIVARALDAPVPRVLRDGDTHIFTDWAPGKVGNEWFADALHASLDGYPDTDFLRGVVESRPGRRLGLFDLLTGNQDRHTYNWLVDDAGRLTGIDHGNSWWLEDKPDWRAMTDSEFAQLVRGELIGPFVQPWFDQEELEDSGLANPIATEIWSHADVTLTRRRMRKLKPEFDRLGHTDWWDYSMRVLDLLEPYATGTGSIYG